MTVFEHHIDQTQVETDPTFIGIALIIILSGIAFAASFYLACILYEKKGKTKAQRFGIHLGSLIVIFAITIGTTWFTIKLTPYSDITATPRTAALPMDNNKPHLADKYREEINAGIADKLGDYTIDTVDPESKSVLVGGFYEDDITAYRDGKNYRLHPKWNYDKNSSTVTLTVDVEQLAFNRTQGK